MDEGIKPLGIFGWGIVLVGVYIVAPFLTLSDWIKGDDE